MITAYSLSPCEDRCLLIDDTDEDMTQLLTVICDGDPRGRRGDDETGWQDNYRDQFCNRS